MKCWQNTTTVLATTYKKVAKIDHSKNTSKHLNNSKIFMKKIKKKDYNGSSEINQVKSLYGFLLKRNKIIKKNVDS